MSSGASEEPPRRKFRYTPIAVLEEQKKMVLKKIEGEAKTSETNKSSATPASKNDWLNMDGVLKKETQESNENPFVPENPNRNQLDLGLCLKGHVGQNIGQLKGASSGGFWAMS